jgi:hypothetical protein
MPRAAIGQATFPCIPSNGDILRQAGSCRTFSPSRGRVGLRRSSIPGQKRGKTCVRRKRSCGGTPRRDAEVVGRVNPETKGCPHRGDRSSDTPRAP